jgi:integrase
VGQALKEWRLACPKVEADLVFPDATGRSLHPDTLLGLLRVVMRDAGVVDKAGQPKYGAHSFRHFFASWLINSKERGGRGLGAIEAKTLLGHSSIAITYDVYGHLFERGDDRAELAKSVSSLLA